MISAKPPRRAHSLQNIILPLLASTLVALGTSGCVFVVATEEILENLDVPDVRELTLSNLNGSVEILGWDEDYVEVYALLKSNRGRAELEKTRIDIDLAEGIHIETVHLTRTVNVSVRFEIKVPRGVAVPAVTTKNGGITLTDLEGDVSATTSNGSINVSEVAGAVVARTSNGSIEVSGVESIGGLETSNGRITADVPWIDHDVEISTSNGNVRLRLGVELDAELVAKTSLGGIDLDGVDIAVSSVGERAVRGTLGVGGPTLDVSTSNGSIYLRALD